MREPRYQELRRLASYGDGCFETMRLWHGRLLWPALHFSRLQETAAWLKIEPLSDSLYEDWASRIESYAHASGLSHARIRLTWGRNGEGGYFPSTHEGIEIIEMTPASEVSFCTHQPVKFGFCPEWQKPFSAWGYLKTNQSGLYVQAGMYGRARYWDETVIANQQGQWIEALHGNLWWVENEVIYTPPLASGCLKGVMRRYILQEAHADGWEIREKDLWNHEADAAEGWFFTNAFRGIVPAYPQNREASVHPLVQTLQRWLRQKI